MIFKKNKKIIITLILVAFLVACDGGVAFTEIPRNNVLTNLPGDNTSLDDGFTLQSASTSVVQQGSSGSVDILIIVDNSISMYDEQLKMGYRFGDFISALGGVDWQIAFTTTDARNYNSPRFKGNLLFLGNTQLKVLNKNTPNAQQLFIDTLNRRSDQQNCGIGYSFPCGSNSEEPLKVITQALNNAEAYNQGFFRVDAALAVVVLSDEDEMSYGPSYATKPIAVIEAVQAVFGNYKKFVTYGMIIDPDTENDVVNSSGDTCLEANSPDGSLGEHVYSLTQLTGGLSETICQTDYSDSMIAISESVREKLSIDGVNLSFAPYGNSLSVVFTPAANAVTWTLVNKKVQFNTLPIAGTKIDISYKYVVPTGN